MADFTALKSAIQTYIKQNGNEEITGEKLQEILLSVVTTLGDSAINDLVTALNNEVTARQNADGTLQQNITNEATARGNADTALSSRLGSTITAENTAADQIGAEAEARAAADTALQNLIDGITNNIENGYVYAGIATPSSTPATGKVFYLALTAGTYTNFDNTEVSQGINILKYNGSAWSLDAFIGIDDELTPGSNNIPKSGNVLENIIKNGSAFDLSAYNAVDGILATYADLDAALAALNLLPAVYKQGGMSFRFVHSSDNKYVQYFCNSQTFTTDVAKWQSMNADDEPVADSENLIKSGGVALVINGGKEFYMPPLLKTLEYNTGTRLTKYENNILTFGAYGVSGQNIRNSDIDILTKDGAFKLVNADFWNGDEELKIDFTAEVTKLCQLLVYYFKDNSASTSAIAFDISSSGNYTWDIKQTIKNEAVSSYTHVNKITIYGISNVQEGGSYGDSTVSTKGFYNIVTGIKQDVEQLKEDVEDLDENKQDVLVSGMNIKTINGNSVLGSGDIRTGATKSILSETLSALLFRQEMPSYYTAQPSDPTSYNDDSYIDVKVDSVPDGKHYMFFTDTHWDADWGNNAQLSPLLMQYVRQRLNIPNAIFGGDYINLQSGNNAKYKAKQVLSDFGNKCVSAFGKGLINVMGNHDTNMAPGGQPETYVEVFGGNQYLPHSLTYDVINRFGVTPKNTFWVDNESVLTQIATNADFTSAQLADFKAQCMMDYVYDDDDNKIRYIVLDSEKPHANPAWYLFENSLVPYLVWYYNMLLGTPANYDVVILMHMLGVPQTSGLETDMPLRYVTQLAMGLKTKSQKGIYVNAAELNNNAKILWPYTGRHDFDFTDANTVGKVFFHVGHAHCDGISIAEQSDSNYNQVIVSVYNGTSTIDQTTDTHTEHGVPIPIIWTTTDAFGRCNDNPPGTTKTPMEEGTVTEQAFDVVTLDSNAIRLTRFGAGNDRVIHINA